MIHFNAYYGMDVHQKSIVWRRMTADGEISSCQTLVYDAKTIERFFREELNSYPLIQVAYEAGGCGYHLQRLLTKLGIHCIVAAPSLIAKKPGKRRKNDKVDATILLEALVDGRLVPVYIPSESDEVIRELTRQRDAVRRHLIRTRAQLLGLLRRHGIRYTEGKKNWTKRYWAWLGRLQFADKLLQEIFLDYLEEVDRLEKKRDRLDEKIAQVKQSWEKRGIADAIATLRGVDTLTAVSIVSEIMSFGRFKTAHDFMAFIGLLPCENSSGDRVTRGAIAKTGNGRVRRLLVESALPYRRHPNFKTDRLRQRWQGQPAEVCSHAWKAQRRLFKRYWHLIDRGKKPQVVAIAVARELAGYIWSLACHAEQQLNTQRTPA